MHIYMKKYTLMSKPERMIVLTRERKLAKRVVTKQDTSWPTYPHSLYGGLMRRMIVETTVLL